MQNRLEMLAQLVAKNPKDSFARYGLAMEYANREEHEKALEHFGALLQHNPNYAAAYYQAGQLLRKLGRVEEARGFLERGIEITSRSGDLHARSEMQAALDLL